MLERSCIVKKIAHNAKYFCALPSILLYTLKIERAISAYDAHSPWIGVNPDAHNIAPLERASGYGNTAGTTLLRGAALK